jgi:uncharacterized protein
MTVDSDFRPAWWLPGPHLQTVWANLARRAPRLPLRWETVPLPDDDFVEVAWVDRPRPAGAPTVLVLHGLAGDVHSPHVRGLLAALDERGWRAGCFHFRGCGRVPNRTPTAYHSGLTSDPRVVLRALHARHRGPLGVVGFSLGANVLLKLLGEDGTEAVVDAAAAVSPPLVLDRCADRMEQGVSRLYQRNLLRRLDRYVRDKITRLEAEGVTSPVDRQTLRGIRTFRDFDDRITAPLHGFADSADYYERASSRPYLGRIAVPTLVVHSLDDPFFAPDVVPDPSELPASVRFELAPRGGHVGFVEGHLPGRARYHVDRRVPAFLAEAFGG